jgi:nucleoside-diphosphate-sugar epimerase
VSPYGVTKLAAENLVLAHWLDHNFPATVLRYFSVYGPGQRPDMAYRKFIDRALAQSTIDVYGSGLQSRSNTYVDDAVNATFEALVHGRTGEIYNIAGGAERSMNDALGIIKEHVGHDLEISHHPRAQGDQDRTFGDTTKAQKELGLTHSFTLEEGLRRQVEWQRTGKIVA